MRIAETLFFAPGIPFQDLDLVSSRLGDQVYARINGFYLQPAREAARGGHGFAAGLLAVAAADALSRIHFGPNREGRRRVVADFTLFAQWLLPSFAEEDKAELLWRDFRNGLVHEARLKNGAQFELGRPTTLSYHGRMPVIDPERLIEEVHDALRRVASEIRERSTTHHEVARLLAREFEFELSDVTGRGIGQEQSSGPRDRKADP